jgi:hypothetical protein
VHSTDPNWWCGSSQSGGEGYFPASFVTYDLSAELETKKVAAAEPPPPSIDEAKVWQIHTTSKPNCSPIHTTAHLFYLPITITSTSHTRHTYTHARARAHTHTHTHTHPHTLYAHSKAYPLALHRHCHCQIDQCLDALYDAMRDGSFDTLTTMSSLRDECLTMEPLLEKQVRKLPAPADVTACSATYCHDHNCRPPVYPLIAPADDDFKAVKLSRSHGGCGQFIVDCVSHGAAASVP